MAAIASPVSQIEIGLLPQSELDEVRRFLFWTYCVVDGWIPPAGDPAGLRVQEDMLVDDRDSLCNFIVARINNELVGCVRIAPRVSGKFETQLYDDINSENKYRRFDVELARFSVAPSARKTVAGLRLMEAVAQWAVDKSVMVFSAPVEPAVKLYYQSIGYRPATNMKPFRYFTDTRAATVFGLDDMVEQRRVLANIKKALVVKVRFDDFTWPECNANGLLLVRTCEALVFPPPFCVTGRFTQGGKQI